MERHRDSHSLCKRYEDRSLGEADAELSLLRQGRGHTRPPYAEAPLLAARTCMPRMMYLASVPVHATRSFLIAAAFLSTEALPPSSAMPLNAAYTPATERLPAGGGAGEGRSVRLGPAAHARR